MTDRQAMTQQADTDAIERLIEKVRPMFPIATFEGPDYATVQIGDGVTHSSEAMTMNPEHWDALNELFQALATHRDDA